MRRRSTALLLLVQLVQIVKVALLVQVGLLGGCAPEPPLRDADRWQRLIGMLAPLHEELGPPGPNDWLATKKEPGQTFDQYRRAAPVRPRGARSVIYVQPLGPMTDEQARIVEQTAAFMQAYFNARTKVLERLPLSLVPDSARRASRGFGMQLLTSYVRDDILRPRLPDDAAAMIAFTANDLWPGRGWNFVFGEASLRERVAVWSMARNGDPAAGEAAYRLCLLRTLKTATHETGHMFSIRHCIAYECNMCGSMTRQESDRRPLALCPQCVAKICWGCKADPRERYQRLAELSRSFGLLPQAQRYEQLRDALR